MILIVFPLLILICGLVFCCLAFGHLPGYLIKKHPVVITPADGGGIRIMSCNVRYLEIRDFGKKSWFFRADKLLDDIAKQAPGVIGFQEVTKWQFDYLVDTMPGYDCVITYRDDTKRSEGCPVFFNTALYTLIDKGSFWLSETPEVMSKDWDSGCYPVKISLCSTPIWIMPVTKPASTVSTLCWTKLRSSVICPLSLWATSTQRKAR